MKKYLILFILLSYGCYNTNRCEKTSNEAFKTFQLNVKNKDYSNSKRLLSNNENGVFEKYIDTIFNKLNKPTLEFIPEEKDGAFGIKKIGDADIFYTYLKEENKIFSIIGIMFRKHLNCYQISNITIVDLSKDSKINNKEYYDKTKLAQNKIKETELPIKPNIIETAPTNEEQQVYNIAYDLWYNGRSIEAIKQFRNFIEKHSKSSLADDAQRMIGTSYGNLKNYEQAIEEYKKVKIIYPKSNSTPLSEYDMAHTYFYSLNDFKEAKYYYNEFINSATEENIKWRDVALEQLKNWDEETNRYTGYADKNKTEDERNGIIEKLKEKAKRDWPNDYTTQEYWINEQIKAYEYMLTIEKNSIKSKAQRDWPLDYSTQKFWYNEQIEARERLK